MTSVTNIRLRVLPRFPARISGTDGIEVVRDGARPDLIIQSAYETLAETSNIPDPDTTYFKVWNSDTDEYTRLPYQAAFDNRGVTTGYATRAIAETATIPSPTHAIMLYGWDTVGDGKEGLFVDFDTGSTDTLISGDGRTWYRVWKKTFTASGNGDFIIINPKAFAGGTIMTFNSAIEDGRGGAAHSYDLVRKYNIGQEPDHITELTERNDGDGNFIYGHFFGRQMAGQFNRIATWGNSSQGLSTYAMIACNTNIATGAMFAVGHSWNADFEQVTALPDNAVLGRYAFFGTDGVDRNSLGGWLEMRSDGAWTTTSNPAKFNLRLTPTGQMTPLSVLSIDNLGQSVFTINNPTDAVQRTHYFVNAGGTSAGTAMELRLIPTTGGLTRYASLAGYNYGSDDIGMDIRVSYSGTVLSALRARGRGQIDYPTSATSENPTSGFIGESYTSSGYKRQRNAAGSQWTFATAPKTTTFSDDANHSITLNGMNTVLVSNGTLTANRTYNIPNGSEDGQVVELFHKGSGAFGITLSGTGLSQTAALNGVAKAVWDGPNATWNGISYS